MFLSPFQLLLKANHRIFRTYLASILLASISLPIPSQPANASILPGISEMQVEWQGQVVGSVTLPDWSQLSLSDLPGIQHSGSIGSQYNQGLGYDLSRVWQAGDTPDKILKLGDIAEAFAPQNLTVGQVAQLGQVNLSAIPISEFPLLGEQTLQQLVAGIPGLGQRAVSEVPLVQQLLAAAGLATGNQSLGEILAENPLLGNWQLQEIDLSQFPISAIPGISQATIGNFADWGSSFVADIPGLGNVPLGQMPNPATLAGTAVARIDGIWGTAESHRYQTVTGSYQDGFSVPCEDNCAYLELDDLENAGRNLRGSAEGQQWISGKYQQVNGGEGCLRFLNGGKEPTGRHPFGSGFKVVVMEPDEATDLVDTALYFRIVSFCGKSPYFIGPFPFLNYRRDDWIFLGG